MTFFGWLFWVWVDILLTPFLYALTPYEQLTPGELLGLKRKELTA